MKNVAKVFFVAVLFLGTVLTTFGQSGPRVYMMVTASVEPGHMAEYQSIIEKEILPTFKKNGVELIGAFRSGIGGNSNEAILITAYRDLAHVQKAMSDPVIVGLQAGKFESMRVLHTRILAPTSFSPLQ